MNQNVSAKPVVNISDIDLMDFSSPGGKFKAKLGRMGPALGAEKLGVMLTIVEPGKRAFPFHAHHATEEIFFIIEGAGEYRFGEHCYPIKSGDVLSAPTGGAERAHQIINTSEETLKYLAFSTMEKVDAVEYPDSDKFLVYASEDGTPQNARMQQIGHKKQTAQYFEGEE